MIRVDYGGYDPLLPLTSIEMLYYYVYVWNGAINQFTLYVQRPEETD